MYAVVRSYGILIVGLVIGGVGLAFVTPTSQTPSFGWFAYEPAPEAMLVAAPPSTPGLVLLAVGIALVAGWVGHRIARVRVAQNDADPPREQD
jgi:hypothetical protein